MLAHYGGVDEVGVIVVPVVAAILLLRWAERRAIERAERETDSLEEEGHKGDHEVDAPRVDR